MLKKKRKNSNLDISLTSFRKMQHIILRDKSEIFTLADFLKRGSPILVCFEKIDIEDANDIISFLSGIVYAYDGEIHNVTETTILFGRREDYLDGTLEKYIKERHGQ